MTEAPPQTLSSFIEKKLAIIVDEKGQLEDVCRLHHRECQRKLTTIVDSIGQKDINDIRQLLNIPQEDRLISQEEITELHRIEKKIKQDKLDYEQELLKSEILSKKAVCATVFLFFTFFQMFGFPHIAVLWFTYLKKNVPFLIRFLTGGLGSMVYVAIYLRFLYRFSTPKASHPIEDDDDDEWQDTMTATELTFRRKAIVDTLANETKSLRQLRQQNRTWKVDENLSELLNITYFTIYSILNIGLSIRFPAALHIIDAILFGLLSVFFICLTRSNNQNSLVRKNKFLSLIFVD